MVLLTRSDLYYEKQGGNINNYQLAINLYKSLKNSIKHASIFLR